MSLIVIANRSTVLTDEQVAKITAALQTQVTRDFYPAWGVTATLKFVGLKDVIPPGALVLYVLDNSDQARALGYHDVTPAGLPLGKAFVKSDLDNGYQPSVTISHELLEILADPEINACAQVGRRMYAMEVCDPCEADEFGYLIGDVLVSDFVTPAWFRPTAHPAGPFDFRKLIKKPLALLKGGYLQYLDLGAGSSWKQVTANRGRAAALAATPSKGSRRERRIRRHENPRRWRASR